MCGESSRFFSKGFNVPKYQLYINGQTLFSLVLKGFKNYYNEEFLFIIKKNYFNTEDFIRKEINKLPIKNYKIVELDFKTSDTD